MASIPFEVGELDLEILAAANSPDKINNLIRDNIPYIQSRVQRYASGATPTRKEELLSVGMMAFYEAVKTFNEHKGHFYPFADLVIRRRIIDEFRKTSQIDDELLILDDENEEIETSLHIQNASIEKHGKEAENAELVQEIALFSETLEQWNISFSALEKSSPKHNALKATYKDIILKIIEDDEVVDTILQKRYFPIKRISEITNIPLRKLERSRIYIIAVIIILKGNYDYLPSYIDIPRKKWL